MLHRWLVCLSGLLLMLVTGCTTPPSPWRETVTQVSTYDALRAGRYDGMMACSNLVTYGDMGLGTFAGLDGEMVMLSGVVYRVSSEGRVSVMPPETRVPFACVTWFEPDLMFDSGPLSQKVFQNAMKWKNHHPDMVQGVCISGTFRSIKVRSVPGQVAPYPPLDQVVAEQQRVWEHQNLAGTMVGFYFPGNFGGLSPAGYHLHFLSADRQVGGHVLDFELAGGRIALDPTPVVQIYLPPAAVTNSF